MNDHTEFEEINLARHIYRYLITIGIALFGLFLISIEPNVLRQYRSWIPSQTFNIYYLTWFAVCTISAILCFFWGVLCQFLRGNNCLGNVLWYVGIFTITLFFATVFFQILKTDRSVGLAVTFGTLIISAMVTMAISYIFYLLNFNSRYHFWLFTLAIISATSAYNWLYLSVIGKIPAF
ncbi:MAG: hypothetical protein KA076_06225 [Candidatus Marinimicrobia bacterium]|nr:hypothetical protein [Candidatus Neomarinimicrobiota bacterium]HPA99615.1 hypothetical protein [Candidatus Neomarinimicrobiota bacterium]HPN74251.1 hypothetical protein [Candidatus Neomarinimicrobiota bacterium]HQO73621.1 hypothetical protein [Candidatus Neomarinimicrobiota bacterium]HQQ84809.1 hypothetical protein [Candidatus Neomarinimicrobiota bacterium]